MVFFMLVASNEASSYEFFSGFYSVYMSANALFPLMALFMWLKPGEYRNFSTLYIAGKIIALISFYSWEIFSIQRGVSSNLLLRLGLGSREFTGNENLTRALILFGGSALLSLADILSVWGAWTFNKKYCRALTPETGGT